MDPGTATLGALALLEPLLKACWAAYGVYNKAQDFGPDYRTALRKLSAQRVILKEMADLKLNDLEEIPTEGSDMLEQIRRELVAMKGNFEICQTLVKKLASWERGGSSGASISASSGANSSQSSAHRKVGWNPKTWRRKKASQSTPSSPSPNRSSTSVQTYVALPPVVQSSDIEQRARQEHAEEERMQQAVSFYHTVHWVLSEREAFDTAIEELAASNRTIYKLLRIRALADPKFFLHDLKTDRKAQAELEQLRAALQRLHNALSSVNPIPKTKHVDVSIQILSDYDLIKHEICGKYPEVELKDKSYALFLQVHRAESESYLLLAETPQVSPEVPEEESQIINVLKEKVIDFSDQQETTFEFIGHIPIPDLRPGSIRLYQNIRIPFETSRTLAILLDDQKYSDRSHAAWRVGIGLQVALAYVQIVSIIKYPSAYPRPENYRYYDPKGFPRPVARNKPYLFWGIGSKATSSAGFDIDIREILRNGPALELGLLLYQIGIWKPLQYVDSDGYTDLVALGRDARSSLQDVVAKTGLKYANIVQACFDGQSAEGDWVAFYQQIQVSVREVHDEMQR